MERFDVVIVGGGVSGSIAGIAAARNGSRVLIIESMGFLGGSLTNAGVNPMMTFHAGDRQVILGITNEIVQELVKIGKSPGHVKDPGNFTATYTPFDPEAMKYVLEKLLRDAGGKVLFHAQLQDVVVEHEIIKNISVLTRTGTSVLAASVYIDATGDAELATRAGLKTRLGREGDEFTQAMTLTMRMDNVNVEKLRKYVLTHPDEFWVDSDKFKRAERISVAGFKKEWAAAKAAGEISADNGRDYLLMFEANNPGEFVFNSTRISGYNPIDPWSLSDAEFVGRRQCLEIERFVKKVVPGFENAHVIGTGPNIGIRSSRQIVGLHTITGSELLHQIVPEDTIAISGYPIDIHDEKTSNVKKLPYGGFYGIPYRALVGREVANLIVTGRCISATFQAQSAIRTTPTVGAIGEAAGLAASMAAISSTPVQKIDIQVLRQKLKANGGFIQ
ncbi:FAD-dependent oxidoreductase [Lapidilactobacillus luobeiensis]|uniref:FAD-dependent oxidoreductase n=1 Tax=Lapidilactobacillus luobeiensis TaxID=2950371 RepID=UPI0021C42CA3|nr:FAD-dependent oxidoreductase [Lapidilactobacillus luobeiensis]